MACPRTCQPRQAQNSQTADHLVPTANSCYNGTVYYGHGAEEMKRAGGTIHSGRPGTSRPGSDPLTAVLVGLAFFLAATIAAMAADLWLWPEKESQVVQAAAPTEPASLVVAPPAAPTPAPSLEPTPTPCPAAVRIRIPSLGIDRSIIEVPLTYSTHSGSWERDYGLLFRQGRKDLVGHYGGSASPGEPGNTILVGHNYGYGVNGVFVRLVRLKAGQQVEVVNATGQTFIYQVTEVTSIAWKENDRQTLLAHHAYLSFEGRERLTLVTCGGSNWAPFPDRVYVVADPVH